MKIKNKLEVFISKKHFFKFEVHGYKVRSVLISSFSMLIEQLGRNQIESRLHCIDICDNDWMDFVIDLFIKHACRQILIKD